LRQQEESLGWQFEFHKGRVMTDETPSQGADDEQQARARIRDLGFLFSTLPGGNVANILLNAFLQELDSQPQTPSRCNLLKLLPELLRVTFEAGERSGEDPAVAAKRFQRAAAARARQADSPLRRETRQLKQTRERMIDEIAPVGFFPKPYAVAHTILRRVNEALAAQGLKQTTRITIGKYLKKRRSVW
jgi:hypothetical protein